MAVSARGHQLLVVVLLSCFFCLRLVSASSPASALASSSSFRLLSRPAAAAADGSRLARTCCYTVRIKTSCASPRRTRDAVSLAFGDAYRDEVYAAALGRGSGAAFERCATDTFRIGGPCGYGVCYLYLRRAGRDGWTPVWVQVYEPSAAAAGGPSTFYYGEPLPNNVWYGFDRCPHRASSSSSSSSSVAAAAQAM